MDGPAFLNAKRALRALVGELRSSLGGAQDCQTMLKKKHDQMIKYNVDEEDCTHRSPALLAECTQLKMDIANCEKTVKNMKIEQFAECRGSVEKLQNDIVILGKKIDVHVTSLRIKLDEAIPEHKSSYQIDYWRDKHFCDALITGGHCTKWSKNITAFRWRPSKEPVHPRVCLSDVTVNPQTPSGGFRQLRLPLPWIRRSSGAKGAWFYEPLR